MFRKSTLVLDARKAFDSGIGTYVRNLIPYLMEEFEVTLLGDPQRLVSFECTVLPLSAKTYSLADVYAPSLLAGRCDVFWTPHFNFPILAPKAKLKVATIHDLYHLRHWDRLSLPQKLYYKIFLPNLVKTTDMIFTISEFSKREIGHFFPSALPKMEKIHLGIDFGHFRPDATALSREQVRKHYSLPEEFVLFVGNLKPNKNVMALLRSYHSILKQAPNLTWKVVIVGQKEGFRIGDNEAVDFIHQQGLQDRVLFTGFVKEEDLPIVYQLATLFVFPSLYEGFGLPPLEAMACGCPVACSTSASLPEVCQDFAYYFDAREDESLKDLLLKLFSDKALREEKVSEASKWVKKYNWGLTAERHIRAIKEGLSRK